MRDRHQIATSFLARMNDPGYRLEGENPSTATLADARRWTETYDRLIAFKRDLLELCHRFAEQSEPMVARAIRDTDIILLEVQISRFEQKRDFWKLRLAELAGNGRGAHN
ncbi:MAG TPA: hypothetical protein VJS19_01180 [Candidatus Dormibacteraeota bacterium]|nr:hypothetical protein [Candidatus Dormibacteraeota bacterium]